jgi:hypothetical protein
MNYKKLILIGDSNFRGDGAEWPKLYGHLGAIPNEFRTNVWSTYIKKASEEELPALHKKFYENLGPKLKLHTDTILQLRNEYSFGAILAKELGLEYENYCQGSDSLGEILPSLKYNCNLEDFNDCLVIAGIPPATSNLTFNQKNQRLKNITINYIASSIMLLKEYIENRGGHFLYMHTEDFPAELYSPEYNPFLIDMMMLLIHKGNMQSLMTNAYYWRKYDGRYFDASAQKNVAQIMAKLVVDMH